MNSDVPYLAVAEFERENSEEILKNLQIDKNDLSDEVVKRRRILKRSLDEDGYSQHIELILQGMGMQKYRSLFEDEDISVDIMISMNDDDLLKLGITSYTDRASILEHLREFRFENDLMQLGRTNDIDEYEEIGDNIQMTKNVYKHLVELNSYLAFLQYKLAKNFPSDYLICNSETGLNFLKFAIKHAVIQSNRMSHLLYGGQFKGNNLINHVLNVNEISLSGEMMEKLTECHKQPKRLNKIRLITTVLLGISVTVAAFKIITKLPKKKIFSI